MYVKCRTNLDLWGEEWPTYMPACPRVGEKIQSSTKHGVFQLTLEVVAVTWKYGNFDADADWYPEVELHIPAYKSWSLVDFYKWYAPLVGKSVSAFI